MTRIPRSVALLLGIALLAMASSARADVIFSGTCTVTVTMDFVGTVTTSSTPKSVSSFSLGGSCFTSMVPNNIQKTLTYTGDGEASPAQCQSIVAGGFGLADFSPAPAPTDVAGQWTFAGSIAGGLVILEADAPIFIGVVPVVNVGTAISTCASGGVSLVTWSGVMVFNDP